MNAIYLTQGTIPIHLLRVRPARLYNVIGFVMKAYVGRQCTNHLPSNYILEIENEERDRRALGQPNQFEHHACAHASVALITFTSQCSKHGFEYVYVLVVALQATRQHGQQTAPHDSSIIDFTRCMCNNYVKIASCLLLLIMQVE